MKTDYTEDIQKAINKIFTPAEISDPEGIAYTLYDIYLTIISILPEKWVKEADVYNQLEILGFTYEVITTSKIINKKENQPKTKTTHNLMYYVKIKKTTPLE